MEAKGGPYDPIPASNFHHLTTGCIEAFGKLEKLREKYASGMTTEQFYHEETRLIQRAARLAQTWIVVGMQEGRINT